MTVLVVYASEPGSTREIAERVASRLAPAVGDVECRSAEEVGSVSGYGAVVVGSAIHNPAPASLFFTHHAPELANVDAWADEITAQLANPDSPTS